MSDKKLWSIKIAPEMAKRAGLRCANCGAKATLWWYVDDGNLPISISCSKEKCHPTVVNDKRNNEWPQPLVKMGERGESEWVVNLQADE